MLIIWKALVEYLNENLRAGKSVNIKKFGAFTFDINTDLPRIATKQINPSIDLDDQRLDRKHLHQVR
jgi:nucleoid DNA-binding protein